MEFQCPGCQEPVLIDDGDAGPGVCRKCGMNLPSEHVTLPPSGTTQPRDGQPFGSSDPDRIERFEVQKYKPTGEGGNPLGILLVVAFEIGAGLVLGLLASIVSQFFYLIVIFPIAIGAGTGVAGALGVRWGKTRNVVVAAAAGLLGGCFAMFTMHYADFLRFRSAVAEAAEQARQVMQQVRAEAPADQIPALGFGPGPEELSVQNVFDYIDYSARVGVTINSTHGGNGLNLGYIGSYIYYLAEVLIVAGISLYTVVAEARTPFCGPCRLWKQQRYLGFVKTPPDEAADAVQIGDLSTLTPAAQPSPTVISIHLCPECRTAGSVEVMVQHHFKNGKGETKTKELAHVTFPGRSLTVLAQQFPVLLQEK